MKKRLFAVCLAAAFALCSCSSPAADSASPEETALTSEAAADSASPEETIPTPEAAAGLTIEDTENLLGEDSYTKSDYYVDKKTGQVTLYSTDCYREFRDIDTLCMKDIGDAIDANPNIAEEYRDILKDFIVTEKNFYPDLDLRTFYLNMQDIKIQKISDEEMASYGDVRKGFYATDENIIYVSENADFEENTEDMVVLRHELGHAMNGYVRSDLDYRFSFRNSTYFTNESLNTILTTDPFMDRYDESITNGAMGYPLVSNVYRVILHALPQLDITMSCHKWVGDFADEWQSLYSDSEMTSDEYIDLLEAVTSWYYEMEPDKYAGYSSTPDSASVRAVFAYIGRLYTNKVFDSSTTREDVEAAYEYLDHRLSLGVDTQAAVKVNMEPIREIFDEYEVKHRL